MEKTSAKGSGGVAISGCDSFFTELLPLLDTPTNYTLKPLVKDAYKVTITQDERLKFIQDNPDQDDATEFSILLQSKSKLENLPTLRCFLTI